MPTPAPPAAPASSTTLDSDARHDEIRRARARATGLLALAALGWLVVVVTTEDHGAAGYARAGLEAAMIGGLADWFAVVAIFRHPLGLPIPHTAVITSRKDAFASTLGGFVHDNFLTADTIGPRVAAVGVSERAVEWLRREGNAEIIAGYVTDLALRLAEAVEDDEVYDFLDAQLRDRVGSIDIAPLAGRLLETVTDEGRHDELVDSILRGLDAFLDENEALLRERFVKQSPWWVPEVVDDVLFRRLLDGIRGVVRGDTVGGADELRSRIDGVLDRIVDSLEHDEVWSRRAAELRDDMLDHPAVADLLRSLLTDARSVLAAQTADEGSRLRTQTADLVRRIGDRVAADPEVAARVDATAVRMAEGITDAFGDEIVRIIETTIAGWDGEETASRLELLLGRDLQFIRINGTVVGGLAGLTIHAIGQLLG